MKDFNIRELQIEDARKFIALREKINRETNYMLHEPNECTTNVISIIEKIKKIHSTENSIIFVAEYKSEFVGYLISLGKQEKRKKHCAHIAMGVLLKYTCRGIGTRLLKKLDEWAPKKGVHRLELCVFENNLMAIHLYKKMKFEIEGIKKKALLINGNLCNQFLMSKIF